MPGLKTADWQLWDPINLPKLEIQAEANVNVLMSKLWELLLDRDVLNHYTTKLGNWKRPQTESQRLSETKVIFELQRDLAALEYFISQGFDLKDWELRFDDKDGIYLQIKTIMSETGTPTFPQMVRDAITAIETDGHQPPAKEMQDAQEYFATRASQSLSSTLS